MKYRICNCFLVLLFFSLEIVIAQNTSTKYDLAYEAYKNSDFEKAKTYSDNFINDEKNTNVQYPYALFLNAKANIKLEDYIVAIQRLSDIEVGFSKWDKINEVYLLKAEAFFELESYISGLEELQKISNNGFDEYIHDMKMHYFNEENFDFSTLYDYYSQVPGKDLAFIIFRRLSSNPRDLEIRKELLIDFPDLITKNRESFPINKKSTYNIAFIAPFYAKDIKSSNLLFGSDIILDFYLGLKKAVNKINEEEEKIKLNIIDSRADSQWVKSMINAGVFDNTDVFIGPFNKDVFHEINLFSKKNNIPIINPLTRSKERIKSNSLAFNMQPSLNSMTNRIPQLMKQLNQDTVKVLMIRDSKMLNNDFANSFLDAFELQSQDSLMLITNNEIVNPLDFQKINSLFYDEEREIVKVREGEDDILLRRYKTTKEGEDIVEIIENEQVVDTLAVKVFEQKEIERKKKEKKARLNKNRKEDKEEGSEEEKELPFKLEEKLILIPKNFNTVFIPSKNKILIANVIAAAIAHPEPIVIIGTQDWVLKNIISVDQLEKLSIYLLFPLYMDRTKEEIKIFRKEFLDALNMPPTIYSYLGYDIGITTYQLLDKYGVNFPQLVDETMHFGSDFFMKKKFLFKENNSYPIIRFQEGQFYEYKYQE